MFYQPLGKPRPPGRVMLLSIAALIYYGWYKWIIQEELRRCNGYGWSRTRFLLSLVLTVAIQQALWIFAPDASGWLRWGSLLVMTWIYIFQFRLYRTVKALYRRNGLQEHSMVWWLFVPGLNLKLGLQQIHVLSQYWVKQDITAQDLSVQSLLVLSGDA